MIKDLIFVLNELAERGLTKENDYLYDTFKKLAYESTVRAEQLLNLANPAKNPSENERQVAASMLSKILNDVDRPEFGYKELVALIIDQNLHDKFSSEDFLGSVLTSMEVDILKELLRKASPAYAAKNPGGFESEMRDRVYREQQRNTDREEMKQSIIDILNLIVGKTNYGKIYIKRSEPRNSSQAFVLSFNGNMATFVVPVSEDKLGIKVLTVEELIEDDFIKLNPELFRGRSWRA